MGATDLVLSLALAPRKTARALQKRAVSRLVGALERRGVIHPTPVQNTWAPVGDAQSPIPDTEEMVARADHIWGPSPLDLAGLNLRADRQLELLDRMRRFSSSVLPPDAEAANLHLMLRVIRPKRIAAIGTNAEIDRLIREWDPGVDLLGIDQTAALKPNDLLYADTTHVAKTGSDVNRLLFEVLPKLSPGTWIRFGSIFYPFEYPRRWVQEGRAFNEAYVLRAFLAYNDAVQIRFWGSFLYQHYRDELGAIPQICSELGSIWLRKVA